MWLSGPQKPGPIAAIRPPPGRSSARRVVRASETRPNCSEPDVDVLAGDRTGLSGPQKPGPIAAPYSIPFRSTRSGRLSGPQKPGPIAAIPDKDYEKLAKALVVRASETRPNCSAPSKQLIHLAGGELSGPQKPGPIAAGWRARPLPRVWHVVRASETRPNCSRTHFEGIYEGAAPLSGPQKPGPIAARRTGRARFRDAPGCPGLRNPAQLQRLIQRVLIRDGYVVRASETRPNCSGGSAAAAADADGLSGPQKPGPIAASSPSSESWSLAGCCPGLRNPAQLQP